ncbi:lymphocyte antigen 6E-like [Lithobates pipiens]
MAPHARILLLAALFVGSAYSLTCYTCDRQSSYSNCKSAATCPNEHGYCQAAVQNSSANGVAVTLITKGCVEECVPFTSILGGDSFIVTCCTTDLCNISGAISIKSGYAAIVLVMGIILMFFSDSFSLIYDVR